MVKISFRSAVSLIIQSLQNIYLRPKRRVWISSLSLGWMRNHVNNNPLLYVRVDLCKIRISVLSDDNLLYECIYSLIDIFIELITCCLHVWYLKVDCLKQAYMRGNDKMWRENQLWGLYSDSLSVWRLMDTLSLSEYLSELSTSTSLHQALCISKSALNFFPLSSALTHLSPSWSRSFFPFEIPQIFWYELYFCSATAR